MIFRVLALAATVLAFAPPKTKDAPTEEATAPPKNKFYPTPPPRASYSDLPSRRSAPPNTSPVPTFPFVEGCSECSYGHCPSSGPPGTQICCPGGNINCPCCSNPGPPPPPPDTCAQYGTDACYGAKGCGWCIDDTSDYNNGCLSGDKAGPLATFPIPQPGGGSPIQNCNRQWTPYSYMGPGAMCVMVLSGDDVRCYASCTYGQSIAETFIVPSQKACDQYDSAFKSTGADGNTRRQVQSYVGSWMIYQAAKHVEAELKLMKAANASAPQDMTRQMIGNGLTWLEGQGLSALEGSACTYFTGDALGFCQWGFTQDIENYVNQEIESIPLVQNINNWIGNTIDEMVPSGVSNVIDDVANVYNAGQDMWNSCEQAGAGIVSGLFGWL
jgi:hypothetical protein